MTPISSAVADFLPWTTPKLIQTEEDYEQALAVIESMMNRDRTPEHSDLFDLLVVLVERYEDEHYPIPDASPRDMLEFWMDQKGVKQAQLVGVIGSSGTVSDLVNGKREISKKQARALGDFFSVDYTLFL
ncbi:MAG: type II toxin-antitoxin system HigA family antitoxin [Synechococcus sp.]